MDSTENALGIPGPGLKHSLNGGVEITYGAPMRVGDEITGTRRLADYFEREGRLGLMLFTQISDTWTNARGDIVKELALTVVRY